MTVIYPVIMVGGSGTRLWPVSRQSKPKQFQSLVTDKTMFQETVLRTGAPSGTVEFAAPVIIGAERYLDMIETQLSEIGVKPSAIILEPCARNTAAVAAIAAKTVQNLDPAALVLLLPSDHHVSEAKAFRYAVEEACATASSGWIATFGIAPTGPETGFGYIRSGASLDAGIYEVAAFVEKPDLTTAQAYIEDGQYSWNAGIFLFAPQTMLDELQAHASDIHDASLKALKDASQKQHVYHLPLETFSEVRNESIDYAVMEPTRRAAVFGPVACGWNDIGSWQAIAQISEKKSVGEVIALDTENCYLRSDGEIMIAAIGVSDLVIVAHEGSVLILPADRAQDVKLVIAELEAQKKTDRR